MKRYIVIFRAGYIESINGLTLGKLSWKLGAGRNKAEDEIDHSVGIKLNKKVGDYVKESEQLMAVYHNIPLTADHLDECTASIVFSDEKTERINLVLKVSE